MFRQLTSNQVFTAPHGKIAPHGIPKSLPPAPSTAPRRTQPAEQELSDFAALSNNYLKMLAQKPTDNTMEADVSTTVAPAQTSTFGPEDVQSILNVITGDFIIFDDFNDQSSDISSASSTRSMLPPPTPQTPDLWSSPAWSDTNDFFSPDADFLNTPLFEDSNDDMLTGMFNDGDFESGALFPSMEEYSDLYEKPPQPVVPTLPDNLIVMTPESPALHDFNPTVDPSSLYPSPSFPSDIAPLLPATQPVPIQDLNAPVQVATLAVAEESVPVSRRKSNATGTRKGVTPEALVPVDAPTQPRRYILPSATSRKDLPSVFAKKRPRSTAFGDEDEEFINEAPPGPDASEREQIEYKRRQNTVAARRSRKRKLEYQRNLETSVERLTRERDVWKTRATMLQEMLQSTGVQLPPFPDIIDED
ncbi:hypothetical protein C0995_011662 [Termitomyces sp. Mi166|nr:hypothetical protein C0995_011662 [Termitomyces sp. Mi166\